LRVNERIRIAQVRVIGADGAQLGVMTPMDALKLAREQGLDLVEVAPQVSPPVCRIMDFNKFRYEEQRREREAKRKHHVAKLKEVKFKPHIEAHDYRVKLGQLRRFLMRGDQAKVTMVYRGRELAHTEIGRRILDRLVEDLKPISKVERSPALDGRFMTMVFGPDRDKIKQLERQASRQRAAAERAADKVAGASAAPQVQKGAA
jgi:translation initiation factor IF-3